MVCGSCIRSAIVQAGHIEVFTQGRVQLSIIRRILHVGLGSTYIRNREFRTSVKMMVDSTATAKRASIVGLQPEKDEDGGYVSGGWKSEDGSLSCGYSSFRGKRLTMEDFYDIKSSKIDGKRVCMFGIFDG
ncbi:probable protein phosphatase 2C 76 [Carica papaya]|uniref:probable protein phosphatase 2C 76 n=1 Tax=Carica papaya TaxID=3649 RepID=UPI000B8CD6C2|nr:probable protein phosphatase 2C 76 [Carica papaya]